MNRTDHRSEQATERHRLDTALDHSLLSSAIAVTKASHPGKHQGHSSGSKSEVRKALLLASRFSGFRRHSGRHFDLVRDFSETEGLSLTSTIRLWFPNLMCVERPRFEFSANDSLALFENFP